MARRHNRKKPGQKPFELVPFLVNAGVKLLFVAAVVIVVLTFAQCTIKKPEAPEWNTQMTVPLINSTYLMPELIRRLDQTGVGFDADSNVVFSTTHELDTIRLNADNLTTPDLSYTIEKHLGKITIVKPTIAAVGVNISSVSGLPAVYPATIPASTFTVVRDLPEADGYTSATIDTGNLYIVVSNNLGLAIDDITVQLFDIAQWTDLGGATISGGLASGETDSILFDLGGKTISNTLRATLTCHTPGGYISDPSGKQISIAPRFAGNVVVTGATARVPALQRSIVDSVDLNESDVITQATLTGGSIQITIANNTSLAADLSVVVPDIRQGSTPLTITRHVTGLASTVVDVPLEGYALEPSDLTTPQSLPVTVQADIESSGSDEVAIDEGQGFQATVQLNSLSFGSVTGYFSTTGATIDSIVQDIEVPKGFDSIQFTSAVLTLEVDNAVALPGSINVDIDGNNGKTLPVAGEIAARTLATAATTAIVQPNVATFLSPLPSQVIITGSASFGDGQLGTIRTGDYLTGRVHIESPLEMVIKETPIETDIENQSVSQDNIDKITDHVIEARFVYNVVNHLPIGATVNILISPDSATLFTNPQLRFDDIAVDAAPVSSGVVIDTLATGFQTINVDSADIQILRNPRLYVAEELTLHGSNGQTVRLTKSDYITIRGRIEVEYHFDGDL